MSSDAVTPGGILAPADAVDDLQRKVLGTSSHFEAYDPDGRRRIVLTRDETKLLDRLLIMFGRLGVGMVYCCSQHPEHRFQHDKNGLVIDQTTQQPILKPGYRPRCLKLITPEGDDQDPDRGYGCDCTRIHIQRQGVVRRIL